MACHMGPLLHETAIFFMIYTALNLNFVQENVIKSQNWSNLGGLADTPICHCGAPNKLVGNYFINGTPFNSGFLKEIVKKFKIC